MGLEALWVTAQCLACSSGRGRTRLPVPGTRRIRVAADSENRAGRRFDNHRQSLDEGTVFACNRFMVYALYPQCNLWIYVNPMEDKERVEITMGKSTLDRSSTVYVGSLMPKYGGGGHQAVGTCRVSRDEPDTILSELIAHIGTAQEQAVSET